MLSFQKRAFLVTAVDKWNNLLPDFKAQETVNPLIPKPARFSILLSLMPGDFTCQWGTPRSQHSAPQIFIRTMPFTAF